MLKSKLTILFILLFCGIAWGQYYPKAKQIQVDASTFNKNLSHDDTDVQKALITVDEMTASQWGDDGSNIYFNSGDVGIGMTSPSFKLDVGGIINGTALYVNGVPYIGSQWTTNGTSIYYNDGNVGIGTSTPSEKLEVNGTGKFTGKVEIQDDADQLKIVGNTVNGGFDSYAKCLLHFDDTSEENGKVVTYQGTAQLDTEQKVFGTASLLLDGNSDYVTLPDSADYYFADNVFTIDLRIRLKSVGATIQMIISQTQTSPSLQHFYFYSSSGSITMASYFSSATQFTCTWNTGLAIDTWYHIALVRDGATMRLFKDGVEQSVSSGSNNIGTLSLPNIASTLKVGVRYIPDFYLNGWIEELRISKGIARWTSDFTPPIFPYSGYVGTPVIKLSTDVADKWIIGVDGTDSDTLKIGTTNLGANTKMALTTGGIPSFPALTDNGFVKTSGGDGTLGIDTNTYLTAEADTLATVTARGNITNQNIGIGASSPNSQLEVGGSFSSKTTIVSGNTTLDATHHKVIVTNTATITLPTAVGIAGREYNIISGLVGSGTVTISTTGGQTIRGDASLEMYDRGSVVVISDGTNWERGS